MNCPSEDFDGPPASRVEDLPVWDKGCDPGPHGAKNLKVPWVGETPTLATK